MDGPARAAGERLGQRAGRPKRLVRPSTESSGSPSHGRDARPRPGRGEAGDSPARGPSRIERRPRMRGRRRSRRRSADRRRSRRAGRSRPRRRSLDRAQRRAARRRRAAPSRAGRAYRHGAAREDLGAPVPVSTIRPAYITAIRSQVCATTPRSWVTSMTLMPSSSRRSQEQLQDLVLDGDVERGRRLVGEQQLRDAGERDGDHRPLAHAAGELVRIVLEPPRGGRDADDGPAARAPARRRARPVEHRCAPAGSRSICRPTGSTGLSAVIGSWKIIAISRAAHACAARARGMREQIAPSPSTAPLDLARRADEPQDRAQGDALAGARFADQAQHLARRARRGRRRRRRSSAPRAVAKLVARPRTSSSGSARAHRVGPQQLGEAVAEQAEAEAGEDDGDARERPRSTRRCVMKFLPSAISTPHSAAGGWAPRPR